MSATMNINSLVKGNSYRRTIDEKGIHLVFTGIIVDGNDMHTMYNKYAQFKQVVKYGDETLKENVYIPFYPYGDEYLANYLVSE